MLILSKLYAAAFHRGDECWDEIRAKSCSTYVLLTLRIAIDDLDYRSMDFIDLKTNSIQSYKSLIYQMDLFE